MDKLQLSCKLTKNSNIISQQNSMNCESKVIGMVRRCTRDRK